MRWLRGVCLSLGLFLSSSAAMSEVPGAPAFEEPLKAGIFYLAPHMMVDDEGHAHSGAAVEYFRKVASRMGVDIEVYGYPFPRMMHMLYRGDIDVALFLAKDDERAQRLGYPAVSYYAGQSVLAVRDDSELSTIEDVEQLRGLTIGTTSKVYKNPSMRHDWLMFDSITAGKTLYWQHFKKLTEHRIDAIYFPEKASLLHEAKRAGFSNAALRYLNLPDPPVEIYAVFSKPASVMYLAAYEKALQEVMVNLTYDQFLLQYLISGEGGE